MITAAGILFQSKDGTCLFLKRSMEGDHGGEWCVPGGKMESFDHGSTETCAIRETLEETGFNAGKLNLRSHTRTITRAADQPAPAAAGEDDVDFTTYMVRVENEFTPSLDNESTGWAWAKPDNPPEPLHPGVRTALARLSMNELDVARAIAAGELTSPQRYQNVWLFAIRITGTGRSYRVALKEFVWRDPGIYLNDEFLARCNGLPVIMEHPEKTSTLTSKEFGDRIVGTIFLPYLKADDVWGIAKIYDDSAAEIMIRAEELLGDSLSTSPAVVFRAGEGAKMQLEDGRQLFIEPDPSLLDHIAICEQGVWDKGGPPEGISVNDSTGVTKVAEETKAEREEREDKQRRDAEEKERCDRERRDAEDKERGERMDAVADKLLTALDSMEKRMDAMEKRRDSEDREGDEAKRVAADKERKDAEEKEAKEKAEREDAQRRKDGEETSEAKEAREREDSKKRKDAEEAKEKEEREDAQRARNDSALSGRVADLERAMPRQMSDEDYQALRAAQAKYDVAYSAFGDSAPRALQGEDLNGYRRRMATGIKVHSDAWKDANIYSIADATAFDRIEDMVIADAIKKSRSIDDIPDGEMRPSVRTDDAGRKITEFHGHPRAWMGGFAGRRRRVGGFRQEQRA